MQVRNFKALLEAAGSIDDLALTLDMPLQRISELLRGENFPRETAHHIEETLQLPSGFLDHVDARVMPDLFDRLKDSLRSEFSDGNADVATIRTLPLASMASPAQNAPDVSPSTLVTVQPDDPTLPQQPVAPSMRDVQATPGPPMPRPPPLPARDAPVPHQAEHDVFEIRRLNLVMLTAAPGAKGKLAQIMGMSPANISHRIHKNKKLDDVDVQRFAKVMHLPSAWFDIPRTTGEVPGDTKAMLTRSPKSSRDGTNAMHEDTVGPRVRAPSRRRPGPSHPLELPATASMPSGAVEAESVAEDQPHRGTVLGILGRTASQGVTVPRVGQREFLTSGAQVAVAATASTVLLSLGDDDGMMPIARALLHTVFLKARAGDLDESEALRLLQEVAAL